MLAALVAFFGGPSLRVGVSIGGPLLGWVALGWGEPLVPWWGRAGFANVPTWGGWGGPRVVNNVVINNTTVVNVQNINVYHNTTVRNAVVVVDENRFGRGPITAARVTQVDVKSLQPTHAGPRVTATAASFVPTATRGVRPPEASLKRAVVATRPPQAGVLESAPGAERKAGPPGTPTPAPRIVSAPTRHEPDALPARPPLGESTVERRLPDRAQPTSPPKPPESRQAAPPRRESQVAAPSPGAPQSPATPATAPAISPRRPERPQVTPSAGVPLSPGVPAAPPRPGTRPSEQPQVAAPSPAAPATAPPVSPRRSERPHVAAPSPGVPATPAPPPARSSEQPHLAARHRPRPRQHLRLRPVGLRNRRSLPRRGVMPLRRPLPRHHLRPRPVHPSSRTWRPRHRPRPRQHLRLRAVGPRSPRSLPRRGVAPGHHRTRPRQRLRLRPVGLRSRERQPRPRMRPRRRLLPRKLRLHPVDPRQQRSHRLNVRFRVSLPIASRRIEGQRRLVHSPEACPTVLDAPPHRVGGARGRTVQTYP